MIREADKYTQHQDIDRYLSLHPEGLTTIEAVFKLNVTKLSTRLSEMIKTGYKVTKTVEYTFNERGKVEKRFMRYRKAA